MKKFKSITLAAIGLLCSGSLSAHGFVKDGIYYNVVSQEDKTVEVTFRGGSYDSFANEYSGVVSIPSTLNFAANEYLINEALPDWTSTNKSHNGSSQNDYAFAANAGDKLQFDWEVSSENGCDWLIITLDGVEIIKKSGTESGKFEKVFDADGAHTIVVKYTKDINTSSGKDEGTVRNFMLISADTLPEGIYTVTGIDEYAFYNCSNLSSIKIPNTLTSIGEMAFYGCNGLEKVCINDLAAWCNIDFEYYIGNDYQFYHRDTNPLLHAGNLYLNDVLVTNLVIPNNVAKIKVAAFYGCTSITSLVIPNTVGRIDNEAFDRCTNLKDVRIEDGETSLSMGVCGCSSDDWNPLFYDSYLDNLYLGRNLSYSYNFPFRSKKTNIGQYVTSLKPHVHSSIIVVDAENPVYDSRDNCNAVIETATNKLICGGKNTIIPANVATIGSSAFSDCTDLESVVIPNSVTSIEEYAFSGCYNLTSLEIGNSVLSIGEEAFTGCSRLVSVEIPNSVTSIGGSAFFDCYGLNSVVIGCSVTSIGEYAFSYCDNLNSITSLNRIPPTTSYSPFSNYDATLYVPYGTKAAYSEADSWKNFVDIEELEPTYYELTDGEVYDHTFDLFVNTLTYNRTLPNLYWNALYVPFELPYDVVAEHYDVAYINDVNGYDTDDNGTIDDLAMEIIKIKGGTLKANYPYLIKAKTEADKAMSITVEDATLYAAAENSVDCSSVYQNYTVTGIYTKKTAEELAGKLAISTSGAWQPLAAGTALNPFRLYLSIENRDNSPLKVETSAMSRMRIVERGETTGVETITPAQQREDVIIDLSGRRVKQPVKGGLYIVNGKKRIY